MQRTRTRRRTDGFGALWPVLHLKLKFSRFISKQFALLGEKRLVLRASIEDVALVQEVAVLVHEISVHVLVWLTYLQVVDLSL